jgi:hypothetical protein
LSGSLHTQTKSYSEPTELVLLAGRGVAMPAEVAGSRAWPMLLERQHGLLSLACLAEKLHSAGWAVSFLRLAMGGAAV